MRGRARFFLVVTTIALVAAAAFLLLAPASYLKQPTAAAPIDGAEHARTIEALRPPKRERPLIAILALNQGTEVTDLLVPYGVLERADVADVVVVAERAEPVPLHPFSTLGRGPALLRIEPQATTADFDARHPDGADYVVVPAMEPRNDRFAIDWILAQHRKGAKIFSVCAGALTLAAAGLLDSRRATTHWAYIGDLQKAHPTMRWVQDRRYVADDGISSSTGITATIPVTIALVEAIAERAKAQRLAQELGVSNWDARHRSSAFQLTKEHQKTFLRNWISFWRREIIGVPVADGVDEIALALTVDAWSRTALSTVVTVAGHEPIRSRHGLRIHPTASSDAAAVDRMLPQPPSDTPALTLERELAHIGARYGHPSADIVALVMEYPWARETSTASVELR